MDVVNRENESVPRHYNIADLFEMTAAEVPERTAIVGGDTRLTYRELDERSNRFAHHLIDCGLGTDARVAIYSWNRTEWVERDDGCVQGPDDADQRQLSVRRPTSCATSSRTPESEALVFERSFAPIVEKVRSDLPGLTHYIVLEDGTDEPFEGGISFEDALAASSPERLRIERDEGDVYILYTGGTTGFPKGVVWRHEDLFFAALGGGGYGQPDIVTPTEIVERIAAPDAIVKSLTLAPVMHGAAQWGMMITLFAGGQVTMATTRGFDPHEAWRLVEAEQINSILVVGDAMARPLAEALDAEPDRYDVSSVFVIGSGGAVFSTRGEGPAPGPPPRPDDRRHVRSVRARRGGHPGRSHRWHQLPPRAAHVGAGRRPETDTARRDRPPRPPGVHAARVSGRRGQDRGHVRHR